MNVGASSAGRMAFTQLDPSVLLSPSRHSFIRSISSRTRSDQPSPLAARCSLNSLRRSRFPASGKRPWRLNYCANNGKICNVAHMSAFLTISRLTKIYATPKGPAVIVRDFDLDENKGEFVCLIGHSGCGKTKVLSMLAGLTEVTSGVKVLAGREMAPGPDRGMVFQSPCLLPWLSAFGNVMLGVDQVY
jgi:ABC-type glutathione transport system ATPase component